MRRNRVVRGVLAVGFIFALVGAVYAFTEWKATQPTQENFDRVVRAIWEENNKLRTNGAFGEPATRLCIAVPSYPAPDARSKAQRPLSWHFDFFSDRALMKDREKQLRQLNALTKAGLLKKFDTTTNSNGEIKEVTRYSLTEKGWAASDYTRGTSCFAYGALRYLGISRFEPKIVSNKAGLEIYEVHAKVGLGSETDLAPWAKDREIQAEFTDIKKNLDGQEFVVLLVRGGGKWVNYESMLRDEALKKTVKPENQGSSERPRISDEVKRRMDELNALPAPTNEEVRRLLQVAHGVGQKDPWPIPCLYLPGSEKLPVDKELFTYNPVRYSVAIFSNKDRTAYDRVANKTIPYLNTLEQLGILSKHATHGLSGKGSDASAVYDAYVYSLTPAYENRIHSRYPYCFPLGEPTVEFVDIQIAEKDANGFPNSSFRYKLKVMYKNPPAWMNDPLLKDGWTELQGVVEHGMACEGQFGFDRKTRDKHSGAGSCWWAFDSYYENY